MLYNNYFNEFNNDLDDLSKNLCHDYQGINNQFFDYLKNQISKYAFQRLLTQLFVQLSDEDENAYTDLYRHVLSYMSYIKNLGIHGDKEYVPLSEIEEKLVRIYKLDKKVSRKTGQLDNGFYTDIEISTQNQKPYIGIMDSYNYTLSTRFDYNIFIKLDPTLLFWHAMKKNYIPSLYSFYLNILSTPFIYDKKENLFTSCNDVVKYIEITQKKDFKLYDLDDIKFNTDDLIDEYNDAVSNLDKILKYDNLKIIIKNNPFIKDNVPSVTYDIFHESLYFNYIFLLNNLYANDFFTSLNSQFYKRISSNINIVDMYIGNSFNHLKLNSQRFLNLLELLATFNIDMHKIDTFVQSIYDNNSLTYIIDDNQIKNYISNIERYKFINLITEQFVFDLHTFLLKAIDHIIQFCFEVNKVIHQTNGDEKNHTILDLISQIHEILKNSYNTTQTFKEIQFQDIQTCFQTKSEKCTLMYLLHYLSIHRDLQDRLLHY